MDYAIEYALMSELFDDRCYALEGEMHDYVNTYRGGAKIKGIVRFIWYKIKEIFAKILLAIPKLIAEIASAIEGGPSANKIANAVSSQFRVGLLSCRRYTEIIKSISNRTKKAVNAIKAEDVRTINRITEEFKGRLTELENLKEYLIKYITKTAKELSNLVGESFTDTDEVRNAIWIETVNGLNFDMNAKIIENITKIMFDEAKAHQDSPNQELAQACLNLSKVISNISNLTFLTVGRLRNIIFG